MTPDLRDTKRPSFDQGSDLVSASTLSGAAGIASEQLRARYRSYCARQGRDCLLYTSDAADEN